MADDDFTPDTQNIIDALKRTAVHSQPQLTEPYMHPGVPGAAQAISDFATGGLQRALGLPNSPVGEALQNEDNQAAIGMGARAGIPKATLQAMRAAGKTIPQIAQELGVTGRTINNRVQEYGLAPVKTGRPATDVNWGQFKRLQEQGLTLDQISNQMGVPRKVLFDARSREGMQLGPQKAQPNVLPDLTANRYQLRWGNPALPQDEIRQHLQSGLTNEQIAAKYGTTPAAVQYQRVQLGLSKPRTPAAPALSQLAPTPVAKPNLPPQPDISAKEMADYLKTFGFKPTQ